MEIRLSGKEDPPNVGYKSFSSWIRKTKDGRDILVINLGEVKVSVYPFDRGVISELGRKLQEIAGY
jgi:hypothetical protein